MKSRFKDSYKTMDQSIMDFLVNMSNYKKQLIKHAIVIKHYKNTIRESDLGNKSEYISAHDRQVLNKYYIPSTTKKQLKRDIVKFVNKNIKDVNDFKLKDYYDEQLIFSKHDVLHNYKYRIMRRDMRKCDRYYRLKNGIKFKYIIDFDVKEIELYYNDVSTEAIYTFYGYGE